MTHLGDLARTLDPVEQRSNMSGAWVATIAHPVPVLVTDPLYVIIPDVNINIKWGPVIWHPQTSLPVYGSNALVIFDNRGSPWVVFYK